MRPYVLSVKNRWRSGGASLRILSRDALILFFGFVVFFGIYRLALKGLVKLEEYSQMAYLPPSIPLGIILLLLFFMLFISSLVASLGTFYTSKALELHLSAPLPRFKFFLQKFLLITITSGWMPLIFFIPLLGAYGSYYSVAWDLLLVSMCTLIPFLFIPAALAVSVATLYCILLPTGRLKEAFIAVAGILGFLVYGVIYLIDFGSENHSDVDEMLRILGFLSFPNTHWLPSRWVSSPIRAVLEGNFWWGVPQFGMLISAVFLLVSIAYLLFVFSYPYAYARVQSNRSGARGLILFLGRWLERLKIVTNSQFRALSLKELSQFSREPTQSLQLLLLASIYVIYLYNIRVFRALDSLPLEELELWRGFLFIANNAMGAFITTAVCTRFIFPSVSFEGKSIWIIQKAPITTIDFVRAKFRMWFLPSWIIAVVIYVSGAVTIGSGFVGVVAHVFTATVFTVGLVGLAVGVGAYFSNFAWEHPSQLAASFGSLSFMLIATVHIGLSMFPVGVVALAKGPGMMMEHVSPPLWYSVVVLCGLVLFILNLFLMKIALNRGTAELRRNLGA
jgi:ABC-2 type transport system permease protein